LLPTPTGGRCCRARPHAGRNPTPDNFPPEGSPEWGFGQLRGAEDAPGNLVAQGPPYLDDANEALCQFFAPSTNASNNIDNFPPEDSPEWGFGQLGGPEDAPGNLVAQGPPYLDGANEALRRYHEGYIAEYPYGVYPNTAPQLHLPGRQRGLFSRLDMVDDNTFRTAFRPAARIQTPSMA